jgi:hypothetical protein
VATPDAGSPPEVASNAGGSSVAAPDAGGPPVATPNAGGPPVAAPDAGGPPVAVPDAGGPPVAPPVPDGQPGDRTMQGRLRQRRTFYSWDFPSQDEKTKRLIICTMLNPDSQAQGTVQF